MPIELIENPLILPTNLESSWAVRDYAANDETRPAEEQIRLFLSWRAVLRDIGSSEVGAGQW